MDYLIYAIYPLLLIALLWGAKFSGRTNWNDGFLSLNQTKALQGFCAVCIMLHHAGQKTCAPWHDPRVIVHGLDLFVPIGYLFVGVFLFCSGYGLYKSYKTKPGYLSDFLGRRVLPIVLAYYTTGYFFVIVRVLMGEPLWPFGTLAYILGIRMGNPNAWYVAVLPIFYFIFYLSFKKIKNENKAILLVFIGMFLYTLAGTIVDHNNWWMCGEWWYNTGHLFCLGLLMARYEKSIVTHVKKHYWLYLVLAIIAVPFFYSLSEIAQGVLSYRGEEFGANFKVLRRWGCLITQMASSTAFVCQVFLIGMKVQIGNKFLAFMGKITMEFYLLHGLFIELFGYSFLDYEPSIYYIRNVTLFVLVVFIPSIPLSLFWQKLIKVLTNLLTGRKKKASV